MHTVVCSHTVLLCSTEYFTIGSVPNKGFDAINHEPHVHMCIGEMHAHRWSQSPCWFGCRVVWGCWWAGLEPPACSWEAWPLWLKWEPLLLTDWRDPGAWFLLRCEDGIVLMHVTGALTSKSAFFSWNMEFIIMTFFSSLHYSLVGIWNL